MSPLLSTDRLPRAWKDFQVSSFSNGITNSIASTRERCDNAGGNESTTESHARRNTNRYIADNARSDLGNDTSGILATAPPLQDQPVPLVATDSAQMKRLPPPAGVS
jgi:hypothetical protein